MNESKKLFYIVDEKSEIGFKYLVKRIRGGEIEEKRLIARPVTALCIDCKTVAEEEEVK